MMSANDILLGALQKKTDRDKQVTIGASNFSNPCARCVAEDLKGTPRAESPYWLGGVIGTATHRSIEHGLKDSGAHLERKLVLGVLPGYGEVTSRLDFYDPTLRAVVDWKTTDRDKLAFIKDVFKYAEHPLEITKVSEARHKINWYLNQVMSYARGVVAAGDPVDYVALGFVCRDGKTSRDVWSTEWIEYDQERADAVWSRLEKIWEYISDGGDTAEISSSPHCYQCTVVRSNV